MSRGMSDPVLEQALAGGNVSTVVRVGDTVRRTAGPWTSTVHRVLMHARANGVSWVPQPLGLDELGREILSFIPGEVPHEMPDWIWDESVLHTTATALRQWHDATADFCAPNAIWGLEPRQPLEVICHNDFAPYNCVFQHQRFVGLIDFDACAPAPRLWDLAYAAYRFVPLMPPSTDPERDLFPEHSPFRWKDVQRRMELLLAAYAASDTRVQYSTSDCLRTAVARLLTLAEWTRSRSAQTASAQLLDHAKMYRAHALWLSARL